MEERLEQRIRMRLKFVEGVDRMLMLEMLEELAGKPAVTSDEDVVAYLEMRGVKLVPWQRNKLGVG